MNNFQLDQTILSVVPPTSGLGAPIQGTDTDNGVLVNP